MVYFAEDTGLWILEKKCTQDKSNHMKEEENRRHTDNIQPVSIKTILTKGN